MAARARNRRPAPIDIAAFDTHTVRHTVGPIGDFEDNLAFYQAIKALPERQQDVIVLRYSLGYTTAETADILGLSKAGCAPPHATQYIDSGTRWAQPSRKKKEQMVPTRKQIEERLSGAPLSPRPYTHIITVVTGTRCRSGSPATQVPRRSPVSRSVSGLADTAKRDRNRSVVCNGTAPRPGLSCDEYPLASTYEGGKALPASARGAAWVPVGEQNQQGGRLNAFVLANRVLDNAPYWVEV